MSNPERSERSLDEEPHEEDDAPTDDDEKVDEASRESFPASDPPAF